MSEQLLIPRECKSRCNFKSREFSRREAFGLTCNHLQCLNQLLSRSNQGRHSALMVLLHEYKPDPRRYQPCRLDILRVEPADMG